MVLSVIAFFVIMFSSNKHFWAHIINPDVPWGVKPILVIEEILGIFTKPFALMIRLFAYMLAGHIIIICLISLIFIFTNLTAVFVGQAMEGSHDEKHGVGAAHDDPALL